jgi:dTDP-4-amino-4,6-dideoxygalactose transaminase
LGTLFGQRFADLHGARFGLPIINGSVAIEVALRALRIQPGDEVIVPAYTFVSTATSVLMVGGIPVFADIDPDSYCLDPQDVARRIGPNTRVILPVHLGGQMADMGPIKELAKEKGLFVVEDSAQAIDASGEGKKAGTWGELGTFSFQSNKTITAGEGGLVMTNDQDLAEKVVALRAFGRYKGRAAERSSALSSERLSSNYRLSEFQSAVLLSQLERFPTQDGIRQRNASQLTEGLSQIPGIRHVRKEMANMKHGYYYYLVRYDPGQFGGLHPEVLCQALNAEGIPFVPGDGEPIYRHPVFSVENLEGDICPEVLDRIRQAVDLSHPECPEAEEACRCTLILRHQVLLAEPADMDDIVEAIWKVYKNIDELR